MFRKNYLLILLTISLLLAGSLTALAQNTPISGTVEMTDAEGKTVPVEGALVELFRVDTKTAGLSGKSDKKGHFIFASVAPGGTYVLSVSGPGLSPALSQNLKAGTDDVRISATAGDGRRLTEDEVRTALANESKGTGGEMSAEEKKKQEEEEKMIAEIKAKNAKVESANATITRTLSDGNKAFESGNFDLAISSYDEGYNASPEFVGSAPILLTNKGQALNKRAVANFNKMVTSKDPVEKKELKPKVKQDFEDAITAFSRSRAISKNAKPEEITNQKGHDENKSITLNQAQDSVRLMVRTESTAESKKDEVTALIQEYIAFETDKDKKISAQLNLGNFLNQIYDFQNAVAAFRKAVEMAPNNADATGGLGLALYTLTYGQDDPVQKQESLNYLQYYLDSAPKDHPLRSGIDGAVVDLKSQKLKPQKITAKN